MRADQAAMLLRCQELRTNRAQAEAARARAAATALQGELAVARSARDARLAEMAALLRAGYDGLAGRAASLDDIDQLRREEVRQAERRSGMERDLAELAARHGRADADADAAERRAASEARRGARRERIHDVARQDASRTLGRREAGRTEDEHALRAVWRT